MATTTARTTCRACGGAFEEVHDFGEQPVISFGDREEIKAPLCLVKCSSCHLLQLRDTVDPEKLFRHYYYKSGVNMTMRNNLRGIVEEVQKRVSLSIVGEGVREDVVIDIGANDGTLLSFYPEGLYRVAFEPSTLIEEAQKHSDMAVHGFFVAKDYLRIMGAEKKAKVITAIAMFYDLDDPNTFLQDIKKVLAPDGLFVVEMAYLPTMLSSLNIGNVCHEHLCYYSLRSLVLLLDKNGFTVGDIQFSDINGGVFRVYAAHSKSPYLKDRFVTENKAIFDTLTAEGELHLETMQPYTDFIQRVFEQAAKLHEFIETELDLSEEVSGTPPVMTMNPRIDILGPSTRGLMLLQIAGLTAKHFRFAVDRNPDKIGKTYHGIPVVSEETMRNKPPDYLLVLPTSFWPEMAKREMGVLKSGCKMILPMMPETLILGVEVL